MNNQKEVKTSSLVNNIHAAIKSGVNANKKARSNVRQLIQQPDGLPAIESIIKRYAEEDAEGRKVTNANNTKLKNAISAKAKKQGFTGDKLKEEVKKNMAMVKTYHDATAWDFIRKCIASEFSKVGIKATISTDGTCIIENQPETPTKPKGKTSDNPPDNENEGDDDNGNSESPAMEYGDLMAEIKKFSEQRPDLFSTLADSVNTMNNNLKDAAKLADLKKAKAA